MGSEDSDSEEEQFQRVMSATPNSNQINRGENLTFPDMNYSQVASHSPAFGCPNF